MTRGLKNNNPGNIRFDGTRWQGEVTPSRDRSFKTFESAAWGYRAMFVVLNTYQRKYGLDTIAKMIARWAPPCENDTAAYVAAVAHWSAVDADCRVTTTNRDMMVPIVAAMSRMENGTPALPADIEAGWKLFING
jgi:hypothetical protein